MSLFTTLGQVLQQQGDKLSITIETLTGGDTPTYRIVISPRLAPLASDASAQVVAYRSALRQPLIIPGTAEECEAQLERHIGSYKRHLDDTTESLQRMAAAQTKAERTESKPANKKASASSKATDETAAPKTTTDAPAEAPAEETNIGGASLF